MKLDFKTIICALEKAKDEKVLVIGDVILDSYLYGYAGGVSTGIKIPIIEKECEKYNLGGAANVASNIAGLSNKTTIIGRVGNDYEGVIVSKLMKDRGIDFHDIHTNRTIKKQRIYVSDQQVLRIDESSNDPIDKIDIESYLNENVFSIIVIADYEYGMISQEILDMICDYANKNNSVVYFSSRKPENYSFNKDVVIVLNNNEFSKIVNAGTSFKNQFYLTKGIEGMEYLKDNNQIKMPTRSKIEINVSGAGDTVLSIVSVLNSLDIEPEYIMYIANIAAGLAVEKRHTYSIDRYELIDAIYNDLVQKNYENKIITELELSVVEAWKNQDKRVVFTNGCYDLLHIGHLMSFSKAKEFGDYLVVAVNSDESIKRLKGENRPINKLEERLKTLSCLEMIDMVIPFENDTAIDLVKIIQPDVYVKGDEYRNKELLEAQYVKEVQYIPMVEGISTTYQIEKIKKRMSDES